MLKGKTLIELTDVKTGKVERFEDENIITDAAQLYYNALLSLFRYTDLTDTNFKRMPIMDSVFGGIKLFESAIEESVSNYQIPSVGINKVVGFASNDTSDGTDTRRGSRNLQETTVLENGVQLVWDFTTSEANGTIACVCLTSGYGGENSYFNTINFGSTASDRKYFAKAIGSEQKLFWDEYDECIVAFKNTSGYPLTKYKIPVANINFEDTFGKATQLGETIQSNSNLMNSFHAQQDYYYYIETSNSSNATTLKINKYDKNTLAKEVQTLTLPLINTIDPENFGTIHNGYIYLRGSTTERNKVYKVDMSNPSNVTEFIFEGGAVSSSSKLYKLPNGDFTSGNVVFDPVNGKHYITESREGEFLGFDMGNGFLGSIYYSSYNNWILGANDMMLHSINNLDTPVTKTADKTMKITYTLTYSE